MKQRMTVNLDQALIQKARLAVREGWYDSLADLVTEALLDNVLMLERHRGKAFRPRHVRLLQGRKAKP